MFGQVSKRPGGIDDIIRTVHASHHSGQAIAVRFEPWTMELVPGLRVEIQEYQARDPKTHRTCMAMTARRLS